ncbi:MAG: hypothetical protein VKJ06_05910 [Vampirovibrionales bacterium]|nr:hypothetical protein [Vampirovibrionales bacterium]
MQTLLRPLSHLNNRANRMPQKVGFTLAEVIIALALFGFGVAALTVGLQSTMRAIRLSIDRDIEAAFINQQIAGLNPWELTVESAYDQPTKTALTLNDGRSAYYSLLVDSDAATADIKRVNLYLYSSATATTPYRRYRREISPRQVSIDLGQTSSNYRDALGNIWVPGNQLYSTTAGSRAPGVMTTPASLTTYSTASTILLTNDQTLFQTGYEAVQDLDSDADFDLGVTFLGSLNNSYVIQIGAAEIDASTTAGARKMDVIINGTTMGTFDALAESGALNTAVVKTFRVQPRDYGDGVGVIRVLLSPSTGATKAARLAMISSALDRN